MSVWSNRYRRISAFPLDLAMTEATLASLDAVARSWGLMNRFRLTFLVDSRPKRTLLCHECGANRGFGCARATRPPQSEHSRWNPRYEGRDAGTGDACLKHDAPPHQSQLTRVAPSGDTGNCRRGDGDAEDASGADALIASETFDDLVDHLDAEPRPLRWVDPAVKVVERLRD